MPRCGILCPRWGEMAGRLARGYVIFEKTASYFHDPVLFPSLSFMHISQSPAAECKGSLVIRFDLKISPVKVSVSEIMLEFDPTSITQKELLHTSVSKVSMFKPSVKNFSTGTKIVSLSCEHHGNIKKLRIQLPTKLETILNPTFPYKCIYLLKDIKCQMGMVLHAGQGYIVIIRGRCKV